MRFSDSVLMWARVEGVDLDRLREALPGPVGASLTDTATASRLPLDVRDVVLTRGAIEPARYSA